MTTFAPSWRLTIFAPRSQDATETTVLTPVAGAAHADPFVVTTEQGVGGARPYLGIPTGRHGAIDPITKRTTIGSITVKVFDVRTTAGGSNAARWVTAFLGNAGGQQQFVGLKAKLEFRERDTDNFADYFTGRIYNPNLSGPLWIAFEIRDNSYDLKRQCFVGAPSQAVASYAFLPSVMPIGLPQPWGNFSPVAQISGVTSNKASRIDGSGRVVNYCDVIFNSTTTNPWLTLLVAAFPAPGDYRVVVTVASKTGVWIAGGLKIDTIRSARGFHVNGGATHYTLTGLRQLEELPSSDPSYIPVPAVNGTSVSLFVTASAPSTACPLLVNDIHPVQFWADLTDGLHSLLDETGRPKPIAPRDTSAGGPWASLIGDLSFRRQRFMFDASMPYVDVVEKYICQPLNLAYRIDGSGNIVPIDLRRSANVVPGATLTDDDLITTEDPGWSVQRDDAITGIVFDYYVDTSLPLDTVKASTDTVPDIPPFLINSVKNSFFLSNDLSTVRDIGENVIEIDAKGMRVNTGLTEGEVANQTGSITLAVQAQADNLRHALEGMLHDLMAPYAAGAIRVTAHCRRSVAALAVLPGTWWRLSFSKLPDQSTNQRGGPRLALCLERSENGNAIDFVFMDAGANAIAVAPVITGIAVASDDAQAVDVSITQNNAVDPVVIDYALTLTSVTIRPDELAALWTRGISNAGAIGRISPLPTGVRCWVRARSQSNGTGLTLPSVWAYPSGNGYVDITALTAPSAAAVTNTFANRTDLTWTVGTALYAVEIFLTTGGVPGAWTDAMMVQTLDPGSAKTRVFKLAASTAYTIGVRHRDGNGGASAFSTVSFNSTSTPGVAPRPAGLDIAVRPSA